MSILKISEAVALGIHAVLRIAKHPDQKVTTASLAQAFAASGHHLSKVMQRLVKAGLVYSERGPSGGFRLARAASTITLLDVFEAIEGKFPDDPCLFATPSCGHVRCPLAGLLVNVNHEVKSYFETKTLAELLEGLEEK